MIRLYFLMLILALAVAPSALAQDDRANTNPGDRVIVYCRNNTIEVWGARDDSTGTFLAEITYVDLLAPEPVVLNTDKGQIVASGDANGWIVAQWIGGEVEATGFGDFLALVNCPLPVIVFTDTPLDDMPTTDTDESSTFTTDDITTIDDAMLPNDATCGTRPYVVRLGDNLFRIGLRFGTDYQTLAACNNIADPRRIFVGQIIYVP